MKNLYQKALVCLSFCALLDPMARAESLILLPVINRIIPEQTGQHNRITAWRQSIIKSLQTAEATPTKDPWIWQHPQGNEVIHHSFCYTTLPTNQENLRLVIRHIDRENLRLRKILISDQAYSPDLLDLNTAGIQAPEGLNYKVSVTSLTADPRCINAWSEAYLLQARYNVYSRVGAEQTLTLSRQARRVRNNLLLQLQAEENKLTINWLDTVLGQSHFKKSYPYTAPLTEEALLQILKESTANHAQISATQPIQGIGQQGAWVYLNQGRTHGLKLTDRIQTTDKKVKGHVVRYYHANLIENPSVFYGYKIDWWERSKEFRGDGAVVFVREGLEHLQENQNWEYDTQEFPDYTHLDATKK